MPRPAKIEVSAINLRIQSDRNRDYVALIKMIAGLKTGVKVFGNTCVAVASFSELERVGVMSKYTEIDIDGDWFDLDDFEVAAPEKLDSIVIPENLKPNHTAFYFALDPDLHVLTFETYSESKSLSSGSVEKFFAKILEHKKIVKNFGRVEADIVKSYGEVERILDLPNLKELRIIIRRPNTDDISGGLAKIIEDRLSEQNGEEYEEILRSKDDDGLKPNQRTRGLSSVAAENGRLTAKSIVRGVLVSHDTNEKPLKEVETYNTDIENTKAMFKRLSGRVLEVIRKARKRISGGEAI